MRRPQPLWPRAVFPRGYCREGHPIVQHTMLGHMGDLSKVRVTPDQSEMLQRQSLEIFTIMSNAGATFADSLAAVLLTGIHWGQALARDRDGTEGGDANAAPVPQDCQARAEGIAKDQPA